MAEKAIYKFTIMSQKAHALTEELLMQRGAHVQSVAWQEGVGVVLWAVVDPVQPLEARDFAFVPTGSAGLPGYWRIGFIGTVQIPGGVVWHLYVSPE